METMGEWMSSIAECFVGKIHLTSFFYFSLNIRNTTAILINSNRLY
uniref:Uncharacterized protein n=1 Tax=Lepeophtheirus salmonis TaxID=72036 RepID=A0A0K2TJD1_LEPSM